MTEGGQMAKKDFKTVATKTLKGAEVVTRQTEEPKTKTKAATKAATFKYSPVHLEKLRALSFYEKRLIQEIVGEALSDYFEKYEKEHGKIKTR